MTAPQTHPHDGYAYSGCKCVCCTNVRALATPAAGVHLGDDGLRAAAQAVVDQADPDDDPEGQFIEFLVPFDAIDALRAALVAADRLTEGDSR